MPFEKVEFKFPDEIAKEQKTDDIEIKPSDVLLDVDPKPGPKAKAEPKAEPPPKQAEADFEIEVVDDTPPQDRNRKPSPPPDEVSDDELADYSDKVKKRIQHFSKGYHDQRRAAEAAMREKEEALKYAQKLIDENNELKEKVQKNQETAIQQAKVRYAAELARAKKEFQAAFDAGESEKLATAQEKIAQATVKLDKIANFKPAPLQKTKTAVQLVSEPESQPAPAVAVDPKAEAWQKSNSWFGSDDEMTSLALGLHQKLVREGVDTRSDEYYDRINRRMRELFPDRFEDVEDSAVNEPPPAPKPRQMSPVAPASRSVAPKKITLTSTQVALAKKLGVPLEEYAKQVAIEMRKQNG